MLSRAGACLAEWATTAFGPGVTLAGCPQQQPQHPITSRPPAAGSQAKVGRWQSTTQPGPAAQGKQLRAHIVTRHRGTEPAGSTLCPAPRQHPATGVSASPESQRKSQEGSAGAPAMPAGCASSPGPEQGGRRQWPHSASRCQHVCPEIQFCLQAFKQNIARTALAGLILLRTTVQLASCACVVSAAG